MQDIDEVSAMYHVGYQQGSIEPPILESAAAIVGVLHSVFHPERVLDVGSGAGAFVRAFLALGVEARGIDGSRHAAELSNGLVTTWDLREFYNADKPHDLVICFDVAEHVDQTYSEVLVRTLVHNTRAGGYILFGPAPEGQDGLGHINCQHPVYWIGRMELAGARLEPHLTEGVRDRIAAEPKHSMIWWVKKNIMVFRRPM